MSDIIGVIMGLAMLGVSLWIFEWPVLRWNRPRDKK